MLPLEQCQTPAHPSLVKAVDGSTVGVKALHAICALSVGVRHASNAQCALSAPNIDTACCDMYEHISRMQLLVMLHFHSYWHRMPVLDILPLCCLVGPKKCLLAQSRCLLGLRPHNNHPHTSSSNSY